MSKCYMALDNIQKGNDNEGEENKPIVSVMKPQIEGTNYICNNC